jgi:chromosome segregation ATPase
VEELEERLVDTVDKLEEKIERLQRRLAGAGSNGGSDAREDEDAADDRERAVTVLGRVRAELLEERERVRKLEEAIEAAAATTDVRAAEGEAAAEAASLRERLAQLSVLYAEADAEREALELKLREARSNG